ncbi:ribosome assembly factor SBDS [Candidatus Pacearchaeota archaeon]|nr:ribosome assembly factor SBDS [Candidatus Pacearchaeota archaeon]
MAFVEARLKVKGKHYEIIADLDEALKLKKGKGNIRSALQSPSIYHDVKKGDAAPQHELKDAFGTTDVFEIAKKIILSGEVQKTQEYRDEEKEKKIKQVVDMIVRNATDQNGRPYTSERIKIALDEIHYNFDNRPIEKQMQEVFEKLKTIIPIKIETKKIEIIVPARYTGQVYGIIQEYKEGEEWLSNGDLKTVLNIPAGLIMNFYDKLNSITHGAVQSREVKGE